MVYPNSIAAAFCYWMLYVSNIKLSGPRKANVLLIQAAALSHSAVSLNDWNNFNNYTQWRYNYFQVWYNMANTFSADALSYFSYLFPQPSTSYKIAVNQLVTDLQAANCWVQIDRLYIHAAEYEQNGLISLKNPSSNPAVNVNASIFAANFGFTGNGVNSYINSNFNPTIGVNNYAQNSASFGSYSRTNSVVANGVDIGQSSNSYIIPRTNVGNTAVCTVNTPTNLVGAGLVSDSRGLFGMQRTVAASQNLFRNGFNISGAIAGVSAPLVNSTFGIGGSPGSVGWSTRQIALSFIGGALPNPLGFYQALQTFATTRGFQV